MFVTIPVCHFIPIRVYNMIYVFEFDAISEDITFNSTFRYFIDYESLYFLFLFYKYNVK